jgi:predicted deacylase
MNRSHLKAAVWTMVLSLPLCLRVPASAAEIFQVGGLTARPGESVSGYLEVPAGTDEGTVIPVTIVHGARPGPVLACVAGVHAYEYPPILALYQLKERLDPSRISGSLILVHIANVPSFARRTIYYSPVDWKNLNRVFPGDPNGTLSQRQAYVLDREVIARCDALLDLHGGDGNEALMPYAYWMTCGRSELDSRSRAMALAFGLRHIIIDPTRSRSLAEAKYLGNTAILRGKPAVTTETGALGRVDEDYVAMVLRGVEGVMRLLGMIEGRPEPVPDPVWIDKYEVVYSGTTGLFTPLVKMGETVAQGQKVGKVSDYLGVPREEVRAPFAGLVLYVINTPPISRGEPVIEIGRIKD